MGHEPLKSLCLGLALLPLVQNASSPPLPDDAQRIVSADSVFQESRLLANTLSKTERLDTLLRLLSGAARIHPELAISVAAELFQMSKQDRDVPRPDLLQQTILTHLAKANPAEALRLLKSMDEPRIHGGLASDGRAAAASAVFRAYLEKNGPAAVPALRSVVRTVAEKGPYPYQAVGLLIERTVKADSAAELFADALTYYRIRKEEGLAANSAFVDLILKSRHRVSPAVVREALELVIPRLKCEGNNLPAGYRIQLHTDAGTAVFDSICDELLFTLLPAVREADPDWAQRIVRNNASLSAASNAVGEVQSRQTVLVTNTSSPDRVTAAQQRGLEQGTVIEISRLADQDPSQALRMATGLREPGHAATALGYVAAGFAKSDPTRARDLVKDGRRLAEQTTDSSWRVRAWASQARALAALEDHDAFFVVAARVIDLGSELIQQFLDTQPGEGVWDSGLVHHLSEAVRLSARISPERAVAMVRAIQNDALRASLLIDLAEGLSAAGHTPS